MAMNIKTANYAEIVACILFNPDLIPTNLLCTSLLPGLAIFILRGFDHFFLWSYLAINAKSFKTRTKFETI